MNVVVKVQYDSRREQLGKPCSIDDEKEEPRMKLSAGRREEQLTITRAE